jgi:endonuclease G
MIRDATKQTFRDLLEASKDWRRVVRKLAEYGRGHEAEQDPVRRDAFLKRRALHRQSIQGRDAAEALRGGVDFQPVAFLDEGASVRRAVAKVEVDGDATELGTGFLITSSLFLTNQHVVRDEDAARRTRIIFDYEASEDLRQALPTTFLLNPDAFALFSPEEELDYALIAVGSRVLGPARLQDLGYCPLSDTPDRHQIGMNVNAIQHPSGTPKTVVVRNNLLTHRTDDRLLYETDTLKGSSGSPVFNDDWEVVALHHYGAPTDEIDDQGRPIPREVNEGIRISCIHAHLSDRLEALDAERQSLLRRALTVYRDDLESLRAGLPRVSSSRGEADRPILVSGRGSRTSPPRRRVAETVETVGPIEIAIRIPTHLVGTGIPAGRGPGALASRPGRLPVLTAAEGKKKDRDYTNRNGFDGTFVQGVNIDLGAIVAPVAHRVTSLNADQANAARGELRYQNFSVILCSDRRLAWISAANIDGDEYIRIDRETGEPAEGESWYVDQRIDRESYLDQDFYGAWSHIFDKGHLTRRNDPTWGTETEAKRANADTFHFANCSPQQWRFNQAVEFWQGLERYVLEKGILDADGVDTRLTVLQGPVFNAAEDLWADDVQIPSAYWKLVLWRNAQGPRVVALVAEQASLLDEFREYVPRPDEDVEVAVDEFRVPVPDLTAMTGLDFSMLEPFDTIVEAGQPAVGEALRVRRPLRRWSDVRL